MQIMHVHHAAWHPLEMTITKWRNRLKGDIVEALPCLKCLIWHDLLFWELGPSLVVETECNDEEAMDDGDGEVGWDELLTDDEVDDMDIDIESD